MGSIKNVKWLPLDVDANDDPKIMDLESALGMEGYGTFIMLIQYLAKQEPEYVLPLKQLKHLSYRHRISEEKILAVVNHFNLFVIENDCFYSASLKRRMERYDNVRNINKAKANLRWEKERELSSKNAAALPEHCSGNAEKRREENNREEKNRRKRIEKVTDPESKDSDPSLLLSESDLSLKEDIVKLYKWIINGKLPAFKEPVFTEKFIPKTEKQKSDWLRCIEKLVRIDNYSLNEINRAIIFAREDQFWKRNFLSLLKLRDKDKNGIKYIDRFITEDQHQKGRGGNITGEDPVQRMIREQKELNKNKF